jgi:channel protein (hemolysin III family)
VTTPELAPIPGFTDPLSALSHLIGAVVYAVLGIGLVRHGVDRRQRISLTIFAVACVSLLGLSGTFHLLPHGPSRAVLQRLDHAAIFVLIAATFTPIHTVLFHGARRWGILLIVWSGATFGLVHKLVYFDQIPEWLSVGSYLALGWLGGVTIVWLWQARSSHLALILRGAVWYTGGAIIELSDSVTPIPGVMRSHELFHIAVLGGIGCHWRAITNIALATRTPPAVLSKPAPARANTCPADTPAWEGQCGTAQPGQRPHCLLVGEGLPTILQGEESLF